MHLVGDLELCEAPSGAEILGQQASSFDQTAGIKDHREKQRCEVYERKKKSNRVTRSKSAAELAYSTAALASYIRTCARKTHYQHTLQRTRTLKLNVVPLSCAMLRGGKRYYLCVSVPGLLVPSWVFTGKHVDCPVVTRHAQQGGVLVEVDAASQGKV